MRHELTFTEMLVSKLGTPLEPFGLDAFLVLSVFLAAAAAYFALEYGAGRFLVRAIGWLMDRVAPKGRGDQ